MIRSALTAAAFLALSAPAFATTFTVKTSLGGGEETQ